jgi:hypothetical protein
VDDIVEVAPALRETKCPAEGAAAERRLDFLPRFRIVGEVVPEISIAVDYR